LRELLAGTGIGVTSVESGLLEVSGLTGAEIGDVACRNAIALEELTPVHASLEEAFMELTNDAVEYRGDTAEPERKAS
jgi:ABC-2 type transport system ATP-binding protein